MKLFYIIPQSSQKHKRFMGQSISDKHGRREVLPTSFGFRQGNRLPRSKKLPQGFGQLRRRRGQRQTAGAAVEACQRQSGLDRDGIDCGAEGLHQRLLFPLKRERSRKLPAKGRINQRFHCSRAKIGKHGNCADGAAGHERQDSVVAAAIDREVLSAQRMHAGAFQRPGPPP